MTQPGRIPFNIGAGELKEFGEDVFLFFYLRLIIGVQTIDLDQLFFDF